ncbi:olfactory receptor 52E8-like [Chanodichthys erythropterus]|uniref:olfactory receptor 52E8-like n=1 Tax=Chanodichthys erythropterus TaxID=933992 RepID=UPI00351DF151
MVILNVSFPQNISVVHPEYFLISGLSGIPFSNYYYIFLFFIYINAVIGNSIVLLIIALDRSLHSPKYIGVFNLALADIGETNALIPNMMKTFLFDSQYISYNACLANMFFVYLFNTIQCVTLVVLAFDRFIAICLPLRYHAIVNNAVMCSVFSVCWILSAFLVAITVSMITRLSFCKSNKIQSYFCDHGPLHRMACNDNSISSFLANLNTAVYFAAPLTIFLSYLCICFALSKITTWEGRIKALKTCVSHLLLVGVCFIPIICTYIAAVMLSLSPNVRIISTSLAYAVPPMLNPIIYVLNTAEVKNFIQTVIKKKSASIAHSVSD